MGVEGLNRFSIDDGEVVNFKAVVNKFSSKLRTAKEYEVLKMLKAICFIFQGEELKVRVR
jgi:hypothetical protein